MLDLVIRSEVTIDRDVRAIWPRFLDMGAWMSGLKFQTTEGERGGEGEIRLVTPEDDDVYGSYYIRAVRVTPFEQYVVKATPVTGTGYVAFADFSFFPESGRTRIVYDIYLQLSAPPMDAPALRKFSDEQHATILRDVNRNHRNLKSLVESSC